MEHLLPNGLTIKRYFNFWHDCANNDVLCCPSEKQTPGGNKLRTYKLIKNYCKMETYLHHISDREVRRDLTKLSCSNHSFLIELVRYSKLEVAERLCQKCNKVEDEIHFLIECKLHDSVRKKLFSDNNVIKVCFKTFVT